MTLFAPSPAQQAVEDALATLRTGGKVTERARIDLKEEAGRRGKAGVILAGDRESEVAVTALLPEIACMANTPGGGALLVGVADDSTLIGTELDEEWVRRRIYDRLERRLTCDVVPVEINGVRVLAIIVPEAIEPLAVKGRLTWRVGDACVDIDLSTWQTRRHGGIRHDWSADPSPHTIDDAREAAIEIARDFLRTSGDESAHDLAEAPRTELLRRLNVVTSDGHLTNAGALVFVGRGMPALDYLRRDISGDDSVERVRVLGRSLLEELEAVFRSARAYNPVVHAAEGLTHAQLRQIPERALREAIVNGVAHREWGVSDPTVIEHTGGTLVVTSPGGFITGVTEKNVITHPSASRNVALVELLAHLRVAEREGIGVDRMYGDMLRLGCPPPSITETDTPSVRTALLGNNPALGWRAWLGQLDPRTTQNDLRLLMGIAFIVEHGWADAEALAPYLQVSPAEAQDTIRSLQTIRSSSGPVAHVVTGTPPATALAIALTSEAREDLRARDDDTGYHRTWPTRETIALTYARARGRISSTELGSITGASPSNVGSVLQNLEDAGHLLPCRPTRRGAGFHYLFPDPHHELATDQEADS